MDHTEIDKVLKFWLDEVGPDGWYNSSEELDTLIQREFGGLHALAAGGLLTFWAASARGSLALLILLDQFSRNMFRGTADAFAYDAKALTIAKSAIERGQDLAIPEPARQFFYLPLEHSESLQDQERAVRLFMLRMPGLPEEGRRADFLMRGCHIVTPSQRGKTHYFWGAAFDVPSITDDVAEKTKASIVAAFDEDKHLLEIMQRQIGEDPRGTDYLEVTLGADGAGIFVRQILNKMLAAEGRAL